MKKKILVILIISMFTLFFVKKSVKAFDEYNVKLETVSIDTVVYINIPVGLSENFEMLERMKFKNDFAVDLIYKSYYKLKMNEKNRMEINTTLSNFQHYESSNVKNIYMILTIDSVNNVMNGYFKADDNEVVKINDNQFKITLDKNNIKNYDFNLWWAGADGELIDDSGEIRYKSLKIIAEYYEEVNKLNDVASDYILLPITNDFVSIKKIKLVNENLKIYKLIFDYNYQPYGFDIIFPEEVDMNKIYDVNGDINMSYACFDNSDRYLYIQPDPKLKPYPYQDGTLENPSDLMVGFISINLMEKTYEVIKPLQMHAIVNREKNRNAYAYMFFNIPIEKVYSMEIEYYYKYNYLFSSGDWHKVSNLYLHDKTAIVSPPHWLTYTCMVAFWPSAILINNIDLYNIAQIKKINKSNIPDDVITRYGNEFSGEIDIDM